MVPIKDRLVSPEFTTLVSGDVAARLARCLASDASHITPGGESGDHVAAIQDALNKVGAAYPELGMKPDPDHPDPNSLIPIKDTRGTYGPGTVAALKQYKMRRDIIRPGQPLDEITGRGTISQLDTDLINRPQPKPAPAPAPPLVLGVAGVNIVNVGRQRKIIEDYYQFCGLETIGPAQVVTTGSQFYSTLEELIDILLTRNELHQIIVNHGEALFGLVLKICKETSVTASDAVVPQLAALADEAEKGPIDPNKFPASSLLKDCKQVMGVKKEVVLRLVDKLVLLRKKNFIYHFRACNMADEFVVRDYKHAFGALMISYHECRLFFQRMIPDSFAPGDSPAQFPLSRNTDRTRARVFNDPTGTLSTLVIVVHDSDGHTKVSNKSFVDATPIPNGTISGWANNLVARWQDVNPSSFVVPMMWQNSERIYHCPLEEGWREKLKFV